MLSARDHLRFAFELFQPSLGRKARDKAIVRRARTRSSPSSLALRYSVSSARTALLWRLTPWVRAAPRRAPPPLAPPTPFLCNPAASRLSQIVLALLHPTDKELAPRTVYF